MQGRTKTKINFILFCMSLVVLENNPTRWDVTLPFESINKEPSLERIVVKNW